MTIGDHNPSPDLLEGPQACPEGTGACYCIWPCTCNNNSQSLLGGHVPQHVELSPRIGGGQQFLDPLCCGGGCGVGVEDVDAIPEPATCSTHVRQKTVKPVTLRTLPSEAGAIKLTRG